MNDYQAMEESIAWFAKKWIESDSLKEREQLNAIYFFMKAVYSKLQEIAPEIN